MNKKFWELVKELVLKHNSELKPCKFYEANKRYVNQEYKKLFSNYQSEKRTTMEYQNLLKK